MTQLKIFSNDQSQAIIASMTKRLSARRNAQIFDNAVREAKRKNKTCMLHCGDYDEDSRELVEIPEFRELFRKSAERSESLRQEIQAFLNGGESCLDETFKIATLAVEGTVRRKGRTVQVLHNGRVVALIGKGGAYQ